MKTETKEIYKCDHCNKLYQIKGACEKHEIRCTKNIANDRPCFGCQHLEKKKETIFYDTGYGENEISVDILYCAKVDSFLYPPKVEHKGNAYDTNEKPNYPMPRQCDIYDSELKELQDWGKF